jgi:hypothetical protein
LEIGEIGRNTTLPYFLLSAWTFLYPFLCIDTHYGLFINLFSYQTIQDYMLTFTCFAPMVLIYLSRYPYKSNWYMQIIYITFWGIFQWILESIFMFAKLISYHNGWNIGWSFLVWIFMFIGLRLHHTKPLWAWALCFASTAFMIVYFHIPISKFK